MEEEATARAHGGVLQWCENFFYHLPFTICHFPSFSSPPIDPLQMQEHLPPPCRDEESEDEGNRVDARELADQPVERAGGQAGVQAGPEDRAARQGEDETAGLDVEAGEPIAAGEEAERGRHAARRAGEVGRAKELAALKPHLLMRS